MTKDNSKAILAIDPGGTSGIALWLPDGKYITNVALTPEDTWSYIDPDTISRVLCENYHGQIISTYGLHTVRIIGGIMALCWKYDIPYQGRPPQARYPRLEAAKFYLKQNKGDTFVVHEADALAHLMVWQAGNVIVHDKPSVAKAEGSKLIDFSEVGGKYDDTRRRYGNRKGRRHG